MTTIQEAKHLTKFFLEEIIESLMTPKINIKNHQGVEGKKKNVISFKSSTIDNEEEENEDEDLYVISKKFMNYMKIGKIKGRSSE